MNEREIISNLSLMPVFLAESGSSSVRLGQGRSALNETGTIESRAGISNLRKIEQKEYQSKN